MTKINTATIKGFSLGLNTYDPVTNLKAGSVSDCGNINIFGNGIGSKLGRTLVHDSLIVSPVHSTFQFVKLATGIKHTITAILDKVYANGVEIDSGLSGEPLTFAVLNDNLHYADGINKTRVWDGAAAPADLAGTTLIPVSIFEFKGSIYFCGMVGAPSTLRWCAVNDPTTWPTDYQVHLNDNDAYGLVGAGAYFNQLAVFKKTKIYLLDGLPILTNTMPVPSTSGCVGPHAIANTPKGPGWVSYDGFYTFVDGDPKKVSRNVDLSFLESNPSRHRYIRAEYLNNTVSISLASGASLFEDTLLHWDTIRGGWTVWTDYNASSIANVFDASDRLIQAHGDRFGRLHRAFYGTDDNGNGYISYAKLAPILFPSEVTLLEAVFYVEIFSVHGLDFNFDLDNQRYVSPTINIPNPDTGAVFDVSYFDQSYFGRGTVFRIPKRIGGTCRQVEFQVFTPGPNMPWKLHRFEVNFIPGGR